MFNLVQLHTHTHLRRSSRCCLVPCEHICGHALKEVEHTLDKDVPDHGGDQGSSKIPEDLWINREKNQRGRMMNDRVCVCVCDCTFVVEWCVSVCPNKTAKATLNVPTQ